VFVLLTTALNSSVPPQSWLSPTVIGLWATLGVALILYVVRQCFALSTTVENRILPAQYFQSKDMILLFICTSCGGAVEGVTIYLIPLFFSFTHGDSSTKVAVRFLPLVVVFVVSIIIAGAFLPLGIAACVFENAGVAALRNTLGGFEVSESDLISALSGTHSSLMSGEDPEVVGIVVGCVAHTVSRVFAMGIAGGALAICCSLLVDQRKLSAVRLVKG